MDQNKWFHAPVVPIEVLLGKKPGSIEIGPLGQKMLAGSAFKPLNSSTGPASLDVRPGEFFGDVSGSRSG